MIDPLKIFELLKAKNDSYVRVELEKLCDQQEDLTSLISAGFKVGNNQPQVNMFGAANHGNASAEQDHQGDSVFAYALFQKMFISASFLLDKIGPEVLLKKNDKGENGFHAVARYSNIDFFDWFAQDSSFAILARTKLSAPFIDAINLNSSQGENVLIFDYGDKFKPEQLEQWLKLGVNPSSKIKSGTILHFYIEKQRADLVMMLISKDKNLLNLTNDKGQYPIHVSSSNFSLLSTLVQVGVNVSREDRNFNRPLHYAVSRGNVEGMKLILGAQQTVTVGHRDFSYANIRNGNFETPLHLLMLHAKEYYSTSTFSEALDILLSYGADPSQPNDKEQTPLALAKELMSKDKFSRELFEILWLKLNEKSNTQLITPDLLFQKIRNHYNQETSKKLIELLTPVFQTSGPEAFKILQETFVSQLKHSVAQSYPNRQDVIAPFNAVLEQALAHRNTQLASEVTLYHQWKGTASTPTSSSMPSRDSEMNMGNY